MANDITITKLLDDIARKLEELTGTDPETARDTRIEARLARIRDAIRSGVLEAHTLSSHIDVNSAMSPNISEVLRYDGIQWDSALLGIDELADVAIGSLTTGQFLRYDGSNWINDTAALDDLSDVTITAPAGPWTPGAPDQDILFYDGANWVNGQFNLHWINATLDPTIPVGEHVFMMGLRTATGSGYKWLERRYNLDEMSPFYTTGAGYVFVHNGTQWSTQDRPFVRRDGTLGLTADWDAGAFKITADDLEAERHLSLISDDGSNGNDHYFVDLDVNMTNAGFFSNAYRAFYADMDIDVNNASALDLNTYAGFRLDVDYDVTAGSALPTMNIMDINGNLNGASFTFPAIDIALAADNAATTFGTGAMLVNATVAGNRVTALRTEGVTTSTSGSSSDQVQGYMGYAAGPVAGGYTGVTVGVRGFTAQTGSNHGTWALMGTPSAAAPGGLAFDRRVAVGGAGGHFMCNGGSGIFIASTGANFDVPNAVTTTHLDFLNNRGELYVENAAEIDGTLYADGDFDHNGANFGVFSAAPVAQAAAYTQTYSTADRTLSAYTPDDESSAYTGIDNAQVGTVYAQVSDLNALRVAYENLRAFVEDAVQMLNATVDDLQAYGFLQ